MRTLFVIALLCLATTALAQDDLFVPKQEKQAPAPVRTGKGGGGGGKQSLPSCVMVTVAPGPVRMDGLIWDLGKSTAAPDIRIVEQTTGTRGACDQTWTCSVTLKPVTNTLQLDLTDADFAYLLNKGYALHLLYTR